MTTDVTVVTYPHTAVAYVDGVVVPVVCGMPGPPGQTGATGPVGPTGPASTVPGPQGPPGKSVLNGTAPPTGATGVDGDFYIDTTADSIYGPKTSGAWGPPTSLIGPQGVKGDTGATGADSTVPGPVGPTGATGPRGYSVLNGTAPPSAGTGVDGDFYIDTTADAIYGPKTAGAWGPATSLIGPQGPQGIQGVQGLPGSGSTSDVAYGPAWDGVVNVSPSQNAVYDEMELRAKLSGATFTGEVVTNAALSVAATLQLRGTPIIFKDTTNATIWGRIITSATDIYYRFPKHNYQNYNGSVTYMSMDATSAAFTLPVTVPDDAYAVGWNGSVQVPTKNAVYDKIELLTTDIAGKANVSALANYVAKSGDTMTGNLNIAPPSGPTALNITASGGSIPSLNLNGINPVIHLNGNDVNAYYPALNFTAQNGAVQTSIQPYGGMSYYTNTGSHAFYVNGVNIAAIGATGLAVTGKVSASAGSNNVAVDLGAGYASFGGTNPKLLLYPSGYGLGVSDSQLDYMTPTAATHAFYVGGVKVASIGAGGITSGGSALATVSQLANYLPLTGGTLSGGLVVTGAIFAGPSGDTQYGFRAAEVSGTVYLDNQKPFTGYGYDINYRTSRQHIFQTTATGALGATLIDIAVVHSGGLNVTGSINATTSASHGFYHTSGQGIRLTPGDVTYFDHQNAAGSNGSDIYFRTGRFHIFTAGTGAGTTDAEVIRISNTGLAVTGAITQNGAALAPLLATITAKTATYTLAQADAGNALTMNGTTLTLNLANLTAGTMVVVRNIHASSPVTIALNSCTLYKNGATASAAGTLAAGGVVTLFCWGSSVWTATGSGLT